MFRDAYAAIGETKEIERDETLTDPDDIKEMHFVNGLICS